MDQASNAINKLLSVASTVPEPGTRPGESEGASQNEASQTGQTGGSSQAQDPTQDQSYAQNTSERPSKVAKSSANEGTSAHDSISSQAGQENTTVSEEVKPAVEHETVTKQHETREQTAIEKERHQDHYHTTVQPLKDREVLPTQEDHEQAPTQYKEVQHEGGADIEGKVAARNAGFEDSTTQGATEETKTTADEAVVSGEHVHHHLHETVQPVIEKGMCDPRVLVFVVANMCM